MIMKKKERKNDNEEADKEECRRNNKEKRMIKKKEENVMKNIYSLFFHFSFYLGTLTWLSFWPQTSVHFIFIHSNNRVDLQSYSCTTQFTLVL